MRLTEQQIKEKLSALAEIERRKIELEAAAERLRMAQQAFCDSAPLQPGNRVIYHEKKAKSCFFVFSVEQIGEDYFLILSKPKRDGAFPKKPIQPKYVSERDFCQIELVE